MNSAKRITVAACALFVMLGFIAGGISQLWELENTVDTEDVSEASAETETIEKNIEQNKYVLKIEDGIVVVFNEADMTRPIIVTDIYASTLRHYDREQLTEGICASGEVELQSMLEDFSS